MLLQQQKNLRDKQHTSLNKKHKVLPAETQQRHFSNERIERKHHRHGDNHHHHHRKGNSEVTEILLSTNDLNITTTPTLTPSITPSDGTDYCTANLIEEALEVKGTVPMVF